MQACRIRRGRDVAALSEGGAHRAGGDVHMCIITHMSTSSCTSHTSLSPITECTQTHTRACTRTYTHTYAHTRTRTHMQAEISDGLCPLYPPYARRTSAADPSTDDTTTSADADGELTLTLALALALALTLTLALALALALTLTLTLTPTLP